MFKQALTCFLSILTVTWTRPDGAPLSACEDMIPGHGVDPENSPIPYSATVSATQLTPSEIIDITISGSQSFKGFLIQVRYKENADVGVGNFIIPPDNLDAKTIPCFNRSDVNIVILIIVIINVTLTLERCHSH